MEGFNNFEQGLLIACAIFSTLSLMWLAIIFTTASLKQIDVAHNLRRIADTLYALKPTQKKTVAELLEEAAAVDQAKGVKP